MIREMTFFDLDKVMKIERESFKDPWTEGMFSDLFLNPVYKSFVIEEKGEISAYMSVIATKYLFEIINIAVDKRYRNLGYGTLLIDRAKNLSKSLSAEKIFLEVRASNTPAKCLYAKCGFKCDGVRKGYYGDEDAILMSFDCEDLL